MNSSEYKVVTIEGLVRSQNPKVSIVMPLRNEEKYIAECLDSILQTSFPHERLEVLLMDGMSNDRTREIIRDYQVRYPFIKLLDNPRKIVPPGMNLGIQAATGDIIVRMDAHSLYQPDYIGTCVRLLQETDALNVGGRQQAAGKDYVSEAIAIATTTPFGTGDAHFRYATKQMYVDTVYLGAWWKQTLVELGGFDEEWTVNQDYELNIRLRRGGGKILLSPDVQTIYYVRPSLKKLARQYYRYGFWKVKTGKRHVGSLRWRQVVPPLFVLSVYITLIAGFFWPLAWALPLFYILLNLVFSVKSASKAGWKYLPILPVVFALLHFTWGTGFLLGLFKWGLPSFRPTKA